MDFLNYIPEQVPQNTMLASFDVTSLYTNIPHELGLRAIKYWLEHESDEIPSRFSHEFILKGLQIILENNHFVFDDNFYLQIKGTAMGTKVAPTYATLVMGIIEKQLNEKISSEFDQDFSTYILENWKRYLDDCFIFCTKNENDLHTFHNVLNSIDESIQFTVEHSTHELPFLDILIIKEDSKIITDLYSKPTDTHQYLDFRSCHPSHTKRNIPFNLARRICTIVKDLNLRDKRLKELEIYLLRQNYPKNLIMNGISNAKGIPLQTLRRSQPRDETRQQSNIPFVVTHNPKNHNISTYQLGFFC